MIYKKLKQYEVIDGYFVTENKKERTYSIYTKNGEFLSTVDYGELSAEIALLKKEAEGTG